MAKLVLWQEGPAVPHELAGDEAVLGRHPRLHHSKTQSNMLPQARAVFAIGDNWLVEDMGSGNGTSSTARK